ncbi:MAG: sigma-70 family RNA polymerase sigma factor [Pedobacter sp.]
MSVAILRTLFSRNIAPLPPEPHDYARLIVENLPYIEKQCRRAADSTRANRSEVDIDNEADILLNEVLDHLKADDYNVLREFRCTSKLTTYLTTVISNLVVDFVRKRKGRSRAGERARELGPVGEKLHEMVYGRGYSLTDAHGHLVLAHDISESEDDLRGMLQIIMGRGGASNITAITDWPYQGKEVLVDDVVEVIVPDPTKGADDKLIDDQRNQIREQTLAEILYSLADEERLMIRLRFPASDEEEPLPIREIAAMLGKNEKSVDNRLRRILLRLRKTLLQKGLSLDDLIDPRE